MAGRYFRGDQHVLLAHISMATNSQSSSPKSHACFSDPRFHALYKALMAIFQTSRARLKLAVTSGEEDGEKNNFTTHFTPTHPKILTKEKWSLVMSSLMREACTFVHIKISTIYTCRLCVCVCVCVNSRSFNLCLNLFV